MNIKSVLDRQGIYDPALERELINAINQNCLDIPPHSIPMDPNAAEELEWIDQLNLGLPVRRAA